MFYFSYPMSWFAQKSTHSRPWFAQKFGNLNPAYFISINHISLEERKEEKDITNFSNLIFYFIHPKSWFRQKSRQSEFWFVQKSKNLYHCIFHSKNGCCILVIAYLIFVNFIFHSNIKMFLFCHPKSWFA